MSSDPTTADRNVDGTLRVVATSPDGEERSPLWLGAASVEVPERDEERLADPADSVVPVGVVPPARRPVRRYARLLPPLPGDVARGWIVTGVLTLLGGILRFWHLGWRTDGGTPLFDEKYYAVQAAEMLRTGGVEDNQAYGVIVHPPLGKQLIAVGEWLFGYNPPVRPPSTRSHQSPSESAGWLGPLSAGLCGDLGRQEAPRPEWARGLVAQRSGV